MIAVVSCVMVAGALWVVFLGADRLDRVERELEAAFHAPSAPRLDRVALLELPYSPLISDDDALALLDEIRSLPERAA